MTSPEHFISLINISSAKKLAAAIVACFILYHGIIHIIYGSDSCKWLLSEGRYKGDKEWQPYGCMMHHYSQTDSKRCLRYLAFMGHHNHFVFMGDSRILQLYKSFISEFIVDGKVSDLKSLPKNADLKFDDAQLKLNVQFLWRPRINRSTIQDFKPWMNGKPPSIIVAGAGSADILMYNTTETILYTKYSEGLVKLVQPADVLSQKGTRFLWMMQDPVLEERLPNHLVGIDNRQINVCNRAAEEFLSHSGAQLWESSRLVGSGILEQSPDGFLAGPMALRHKTQILLNIYCNDHMNFDDGSCCSYPESATTLQLVTLCALGLCFLIGGGTWLYYKICQYQPEILHTRVSTQENDGAEEGMSEVFQNEPQQTQSFYVLATSLALLSMILGYFYLCDRTNFFMKENKYYSEFSFWLPLGYTLALGLFFTEDRERGPRALNREQTDEWRGLMQAVVLIYHVTGAKNVLPIYMHLRLINSAYLFLSGYGHFCYFWQTGDLSLVRFARVLFRLNLLTVALCLCMNRPYQFYNFVPLVSFWFFVIYFLLWLPPRVWSGSLAEYGSRALLYLAVKLIGLAAIITILYMSEVFFEKIFVTRPWKALFVTTDDDIREWWQKWRVDRYSVAWGVAFGALLVVLQRVDVHIPGINFAPILALAGLTAYLAFTLLCQSVSDCEEIHSYVAFLPILGYIILRNASVALRGKHSALFAGLGRMSLETLISQGHVWLAADSHGVLVLLPRFPVLNLLVSLFIFICASHELHRLTKVLVPYAVPNDWRSVTRNLLLFVAVLVPIGIHDGMF